MEVVPVDGAAEAGAVVADIVAAAVSSGARVLGLATGSSPLTAYKELGRRCRVGEVSLAGLDA